MFLWLFLSGLFIQNSFLTVWRYPHSIEGFLLCGVLTFHLQLSMFSLGCQCSKPQNCQFLSSCHSLELREKNGCFGEWVCGGIVCSCQSWGPRAGRQRWGVPALCAGAYWHTLHLWCEVPRLLPGNQRSSTDLERMK